MVNGLFNEDCVSGILSHRQKYSLVVTSPPYNAGKEYENALSIQEYRRFAQQWLSAVSDKLSDTGSLWLNVGYIRTGKNRALPLTYLYYEIATIPLVQEVVWHYEGGMAYKKRFAHRTERWMWFSKNPSKVVFNLDRIRDSSLNRTRDQRNNPSGKNPGDCWYFDRVSNNSADKTIHPCQFPVKMIERIVLACSDKGDEVLDPFMGSGTVGVVCKMHERNFTGYETDPAYFKVANERISRQGKCESMWIPYTRTETEGVLWE